MGNTGATSLVDSATTALISRANDIVNACTGPQCNISPGTQAAVRVGLADLANAQATQTLGIVGVDPLSTTGREIYDGYIDLANVIAATYNYQCNDNVATSFVCVTSAQAVINSQNRLEQLLIKPAGAALGRTVIVGTLAVVAIVSIFIYLTFFIIGLTWSTIGGNNQSIVLVGKS